MRYAIRMNFALILAVHLCGNYLQAAENSSAGNNKANEQIDDTSAIRVMTFNIRYNNPQDGKNAWKHRKEKVASMIRLHRTDLAGLQEVQDDQLAELQQLLPEWNWAGLRSRGGKNEKGDEHVPILYRANRFDLLDQGVFWLSETPEVPVQHALRPRRQKSEDRKREVIEVPCREHCQGSTGHPDRRPKLLGHERSVLGSVRKAAG
jgi:hypothetical protein